MDIDYPLSIHDYGYIGDCHSSALISKFGSIDWCCMPRVDSASCFGRLLDWNIGGYCQIVPTKSFTTSRNYIDGTMILETYYQVGDNAAKIIDFFTMRKGGALKPHQQILRIVEGISGHMQLKLDIVPRFDYGTVKPWIRHYKKTSFIALGGNDGLLFSGDINLAIQGPHHLSAIFHVRAKQRRYLSIFHRKPEELDELIVEVPSIDELDIRLDQSIAWWHKWLAQGEFSGSYTSLVKRSALVLKCLSNAPTGAIAAAATTSLPECFDCGRNWDYRYSWIRDSYFSVRILTSVGFVKEADGFRKFIERSSCSSADGLQTVFGVSGNRRLHEYVIPELAGYRGSKPVRIGNAAESQLQLDIYGLLIDLAWQWQQRGCSPNHDYWLFLVGIIEFIINSWQKPDCGIWERRDMPRQYVHSKAMCWVCLDRGIRLAEVLNEKKHLKKWRMTRQHICQAIEEFGYDKSRGVFKQAYDSDYMDAALLILPMVGFVDYNDERMIRTTEAIWQDLQQQGLLRRYPKNSDSLPGEEGVFLPCTFWLVICYVHQGKIAQAQEIFNRTIKTANDIGLFSEEFDTNVNEMLGNFPQALTHLSLIAAATRLSKV